MSLSMRIRWFARKNVEQNDATSSLAERLDRYVASIERSTSETTAKERMALRARLETAFDRW